MLCAIVGVKCRVHRADATGELPRFAHGPAETSGDVVERDAPDGQLCQAR
jgi:hypothetical protein